MSGGTEREQNDPDDHENDADRPQNRDPRQETDDQQDNSENDQGILLIRSPIAGDIPAGHNPQTKLLDCAQVPEATDSSLDDFGVST